VSATRRPPRWRFLAHKWLLTSQSRSRNRGPAAQRS
jgi:hypothetical protein